MSGIQYVVAGMRFEPEDADLRLQAFAHVCPDPGIGLSFVPDPAAAFRNTRPKPTHQRLTGPQFRSPMRQRILLST